MYINYGAEFYTKKKYVPICMIFPYLNHIQCVMSEKTLYMVKGFNPVNYGMG